MATWELQVTYPLAPAPAEYYQAVAIGINSNALAYGFRLEGTGTLPINWQSLGYWAWIQGVGGPPVVGALNQIINPGPDLVSPIHLIGASQVDVLGLPLEFAGLVVAVNRWVPRTGLSVFVLLP